MPETARVRCEEINWTPCGYFHVGISKHRQYNILNLIQKGFLPPSIPHSRSPSPSQGWRNERIAAFELLFDGRIVLSQFSRVWLCDPLDCSPPGSSVHGGSPGKNAGVGCHSPLQEIFPTQGSNPRFLCLTALAGKFFNPSATGLKFS